MAGDDVQPRVRLTAGAQHAARGPLVVSPANPRYFTVASDQRDASVRTHPDQPLMGR